LLINCLITQVIEETIKGRDDEEENLSSYWITKRRILEVEKGGTRPHSVENSLWKRLWTCHNTSN
jgi:hypothetical protein